MPLSPGTQPAGAADVAADAGSARPTIVFSHANGFPAGTYETLFRIWREAGWRLAAVDKYGHDPRYPVSSNWPHLCEQLIHFAREQGGGQPVHLVGHSLGGYLSLLAACRAPELAAGVVLLDSPVLDGWRAHTVRMAKATGLVRRVTPGRISHRRRWQWPDGQAALHHFAAKPVFARWHPDVLADYVLHGTEPDPDGTQPGAVRLSFRREVETRLYNTLPHHLGTLLRTRKPTAPVSFVGGTHSTELRQVGLAATRALVKDRLRWVDGTHRFPMEKPHETARRVLELLAPMRRAGDRTT
jgi:pimeloyl-ACP methyl ester carboxylesterase